MVLQHTKHEERQARLEEFRALLKQRIVLLDCAMGTMIQSYDLSEEDFRGERFADHPTGAQGQQRPALYHPATDDTRHPRGRHGGRLGHHRDQHLQLHFHRPEGLRDGGPRLRDQLRGGPRRPRGGRRLRDAGETPLRGRRARAHEQDGVALARRQQPRLQEHHLRRARRILRGGGAGARRGRGRPAARRDHIRHVERQGRHIRDHGLPRRGRPRRSRHDLGHDHRRERTHALGTGDRSVLELCAPRTTPSASA